MSVQFEEENKYNFSYKSLPPRGITGWMIKNGYVKDEVGAKKVMITITIVCLVLTLIRILL